MTTHRIELDTFSLNVHGPRTAELDKLTERHGRYNKRSGTYEFPKAAEAEVRAIIDTSTAGTPAASSNPTGWSNASRRHTGHGHSHPLGEVTHAGDGFTEYEDTAFGGGRVQIWDES